MYFFFTALLNTRIKVSRLKYDYDDSVGTHKGETQKQNTNSGNIMSREQIFFQKMNSFLKFDLLSVSTTLKKEI